MLKSLGVAVNERHEARLLAAYGALGGAFRYYRPEITAKRGWLAIGAVVAAHELLCPNGETLSEGYDRGLEHSRIALTVGTLVVTGHLLNMFGRFDPVSAGLNVIKKL